MAAGSRDSVAVTGISHCKGLQEDEMDYEKRLENF